MKGSSPVARMTFDGADTTGPHRDGDRMSSKTTVFLVVRVRMYREALETVLSGLDLVVVGHGTDPISVAPVVHRRAPDVALVECSGAPEDCVRLVVSASPRTRVVIVAPLPSDCASLRWAESGALGCLSPDATVMQVRRAIENAARGEFSCSAATAGALVRRVRELASLTHLDRSLVGGVETDLTARELEVIALIQRGMTNREIAESLGIAHATVKNHVHSLLRKLHACSRQDAIRVLDRELGSPDVVSPEG